MGFIIYESESEAATSEPPSFQPGKWIRKAKGEPCKRKFSLKVFARPSRWVRKDGLDGKSGMREPRSESPLGGDPSQVAVDPHDPVGEGGARTQATVIAEQRPAQVAGMVVEVFDQDPGTDMDVFCRIE